MEKDGAYSLTHDFLYSLRGENVKQLYLEAKSWTRQGSFLLVFFFLLMTDCLFLELDRLNIGHHICDLYVPCVILADDTS